MARRTSLPLLNGEIRAGKEPLIITHSFLLGWTIHRFKVCGPYLGFLNLPSFPLDVLCCQAQFMGMKRVIYVCVSIFLASQVAAQSHPASLSVESNAPGNALSEAFRAKAGGDWGTALGLASTAGPAAFDVIEWQRLRASQGTLEDTLSFISRRPDWPGLPLLRKRSEKTITVVKFDERTSNQ